MLNKVGEIMGNKDGTIEIKAEQVKVVNPTGSGSYPLLKVDQNVNVYLDGEKIDEETVVFADSKIEIEKIEEKSQKDLNLKITQEALQAYLNINIKSGYKVKIKDHPPASVVKLETEKIITAPVELTESDISILLLKNRVRYGVKKELLTKIINNNQTGEFLIAEGNKPVSGQDARINLIEKEDEQCKSGDFNCITSFAEGEIVAEKQPAVPGKDGINVLREKITAPPVKDYQLVAGKGSKLINDGSQAVATEVGRPKLEKKKDQFIVTIVPQYIIEGDVDKTTGNIRYQGDLIVQGNIFDYFDVRVGNNLHIAKSIAGCNANANGDIIVGQNIVNSQIKAGLYLSRKLVADLKKLFKELEDMIAAVNEILGAAQERMGFLQRNLQLGRILKLLLIDKFKQIPILINKLADKTSTYDYDWEAISTISEMKQLFKGYKKILRINDLDIFIKLKDQLEVIIDAQHNLKEANVSADYIQNSTINAASNVIIRNKGCYNSEISAGKNIINIGQQGFVKGGKYSAEDFIYLKVVNSSLSRTDFRIGKGIYVQYIESNVKIESDNDVIFIDQPQNNLYLAVNSKGELEQQAGSPDFKELKKLVNYQSESSKN